MLWQLAENKSYFSSVYQMHRAQVQTFIVEKQWKQPKLAKHPDLEQDYRR